MSSTFNPTSNQIKSTTKPKLSNKRRRTTIGTLDDWNLNNQSSLYDVLEKAGSAVEKSDRRGEDGIITEEESLDDDTYSLYGTSSNNSSSSNLNQKNSIRKKKSKQHERSKSVGEINWNELSEAQLNRTDESIFGLDLEYLTRSGSDSSREGGGDSTSDDSSFPSTPNTGLSNSSSTRSSPTPSNYECELRDASFLIPRWNMNKPRIGGLHIIPGPLKRRHTSSPTRSSFSAKTRLRTSSISFTIVSPLLLSPTSPISPSNYSIPLPTFTLIISILCLSISIFSLISPIPVLPISPVQLLRGQSQRPLEYLNALLSLFLIELTSSSSIILSIGNILILKSLEENLFSSSKLKSLKSKFALLSIVWINILLVRVTLCWLFGRVLGWAYPDWFSTEAIHQVGSGLAPLLLSLLLIQSASSSLSTTTSSPTTTNTSSLLFQFSILAANFFTPIEFGGTGFWWGLSGSLVGLVFSILVIGYKSVTSLKKVKKVVAVEKVEKESLKCSTFFFNSFSTFIIFFLLFSLPLLSNYSTISAKSSESNSITLSTNQSISTQFNNLYSSNSNLSSSRLLTILLLTAPRPGDPNYLFQTIESWLGALPLPSSESLANSTTTTTSKRIKLIIYTHFDSHKIFDQTQLYFNKSPKYKEKSSFYVQWIRDERSIGKNNTLDQRLHVARGLNLVTSGEVGNSEYVLLTEDDFPLCPDQDEEGEEGEMKWDKTWKELQRLLVETNLIMPDFTSSTSTSSNSTPSSILSSSLQSQPQPGHCGILFSTGGSGIIMKSSIASKIPSILLGSNDSNGIERERLIESGELKLVGKEGKDSDTPDVVIQDCLRGKLEECSECSPLVPSVPFISSSASSLPYQQQQLYPKGSKRNPYSNQGERNGKSGTVATKKLLQYHLGFNASTLPGRKYGKEEWGCKWRSPFNGEPDILIL